MKIIIVMQRGTQLHTQVLYQQESNSMYSCNLSGEVLFYAHANVVLQSHVRINYLLKNLHLDPNGSL